MTETNPLGTVAHVRSSVGRLHEDPAASLQTRASQGYPVPFIDQRHVDAGDRPLPWDGRTMGELEVRGPWVASSYFGGEGEDRFTKDGWFKTGDVVTIDGEGYMRIADRTKDVIKSGGEWISSVALENALMSHPAVLEAAVFAARHPLWGERPLAAIVLRQGQSASKSSSTPSSSRASRSSGSRTSTSSSSGSRAPRPASSSNRSCARSSPISWRRRHPDDALTRPRARGEIAGSSRQGVYYAAAMAEGNPRISPPR